MSDRTNASGASAEALSTNDTNESATGATTAAATTVAESTPLPVQTRQTPLICRGHSRPVPDLFFSNVCDDGFFLVSGCLDGKAMLRKGETGDWIGTFLGHRGAVWSARLDTHAVRCVTGSADFTAKLWDAVSGDELHSFDHKPIVRSVAFSPDDNKIVTGGQEKLLRVFDLDKLDAEPRVLEGHTDMIRSILFLPSVGTGQEVFLSASLDGTMRMWDLRESGKSEARLFNFDDGVTDIELSRDGKSLTTSAGKQVQFWDAARYEITKRVDTPYKVHSATVHPSGHRFVAGGDDLSVHVYDFESEKEVETHRGHHGPVHCVRFSPDGEIYASGSEDGTIRLYQTKIKPYGLWQVSDPNNAS